MALLLLLLLLLARVTTTWRNTGGKNNFIAFKYILQGLSQNVASHNAKQFAQVILNICPNIKYDTCH